jgi:hypothetical protein
MTEEIKVRFKTVFKNVIPAVVVMTAGLIGTYLVYNNYLSDRVSASQVSGLEPAAGGDETITAAPAASDEQFTPAAAPSTTGGAAAVKVYKDEGEDSGNGPDTATSPASGTATPPVAGDTPVKPAPAPATTPPAAQ